MTQTPMLLSCIITLTSWGTSHCQRKELPELNSLMAWLLYDFKPKTGQLLTVSPMCEDVSLCHWPPQGLHNGLTEKSWRQRWRLTMGPQPVLPYHGRKLLLLLLLNVLPTGNRNQCRVSGRHHAFELSSHLLASWLDWTPAIWEKAMFHPDKDWQGCTYGFTFPAYSGSANTTIQGLTECLVYAWAPTQHCCYELNICVHQKSYVEV